MELFDAVRAFGMRTPEADALRGSLERYAPEDHPRVVEWHPHADPWGEDLPQDSPPGMHTPDTRGGGG